MNCVQISTIGNHSRNRVARERVEHFGACRDLREDGQFNATMDSNRTRGMRQKIVRTGGDGLLTGAAIVMGLRRADQRIAQHRPAEQDQQEHDRSARLRYHLSNYTAENAKWLI